MLSSTEIITAINAGILAIRDYEEDCLRPSSYLLRLGRTILVQRPEIDVIDTRRTDTTDMFESHQIPAEGFLVHPGRLYLGCSLERLSLGPSIAGQLSLLSSLARVGLQANFSSTLVSATFGQDEPSALTFELFNQGNRPIRVYSGAKLCHILFFYHASPSSRKYNGIYGASALPVPADFAKRPSR